MAHINVVGKLRLGIVQRNLAPQRGWRPAYDALLRACAPLPGIALCVGVSLCAYGLQWAQASLCGHIWLETLVLAILLGMTIRTCWAPSVRWQRGIDFSAKILLEIAVVLLGASLCASTLLASGLPLLLSIAGVVIAAIAISYGISRALGLHWRLAVLIACGNAICGNSAIAAVAPVVKADCDEIASSIAFTAVLGIIVVLTLPLIMSMCHLTELQYGALAGMTVYAVPQVLAATAPISLVSANIGTLVKLVRVLMLGPVILTISVLLQARRGTARTQVTDPVADCASESTRSEGIGLRGLAWHKLMPWFIIGFMIMMVARSTHTIPTAWLRPLGSTASALTIVSMAALGLGVDIRSVAQAGARVSAAVVLSIIALTGVSLAVIHILSINGLLG